MEGFVGDEKGFMADVGLDQQPVKVYEGQSETVWKRQFHVIYGGIQPGTFIFLRYLYFTYNF